MERRGELETAIDFSSSRVSSLPVLTHAPWRLHGEAVVLLRDWTHVLAFVKYFDSPVGPYLERAEATLARHKKYFGPHVTRMDVTSPASMQEGRRIWGYPKEVQPIKWKRRGNRLEIDSDGVWRFRLARTGMPLALAGWSWQNCDGQDVKVPFRIAGRAYPAWRGRQWAWFIENFTLDVLEPC